MMDLESTYQVISKVMDYTAARSRALALNLGNQNTPGYRRVDVDFESLFDAMREQDKDSRSRALRSIHPEIVLDDAARPGLNGNSVDQERELVALSQMALVHQLATQMASGRTQGLRMAISGRTG